MQFEKIRSDAWLYVNGGNSYVRCCVDWKESHTIRFTGSINNNIGCGMLRMLIKKTNS